MNIIKKVRLVHCFNILTFLWFSHKIRAVRDCFELDMKEFRIWKNTLLLLQMCIAKEVLGICDWAGKGTRIRSPRGTNTKWSVTKSNHGQLDDITSQTRQGKTNSKKNLTKKLKDKDGMVIVKEEKLEKKVEH